MSASSSTPYALAAAALAVIGLTACGSAAPYSTNADTVTTMADPTTEPPTGGNDASADATVTTPPDETTSPPPTFTATPLPEDGRPLPPGDDIDHGATLVRDAVADLAVRLDIGADDIEVLAARAVTWPDSSYGCPEPGMLYLQRQADGALVVLEAEGHQYRYHGGSPLVLCEQPGADYVLD